MRHRHLGQAPHQQKRDQPPKRIAQQHARTGEMNRETAAEKKARANGAPNRDHRKLPGGQLTAESFFTLRDRIEMRTGAAHETVFRFYPTGSIPTAMEKSTPSPSLR